MKNHEKTADHEKNSLWRVKSLQHVTILRVDGVGKSVTFLVENFVNFLEKRMCQSAVYKLRCHLLGARQTTTPIQIFLCTKFELVFPIFSINKTKFGFYFIWNFYSIFLISKNKARNRNRNRNRNSKRKCVNNLLFCFFVLHRVRIITREFSGIQFQQLLKCAEWRWIIHLQTPIHPVKIGARKVWLLYLLS
jgi:hypothetical protein